MAITKNILKKTSTIEGPVGTVLSRKEGGNIVLDSVVGTQTFSTERTSHTLDIPGDLTTYETVRTGIKALTGSLVLPNIGDEIKEYYIGYVKHDTGELSAGPENTPQETAITTLERRYDGTYNFIGIPAIRLGDPGSNASNTSTDSASYEAKTLQFSARSVLYKGKQTFVIEEENVDEARIQELIEIVHTARFNESGELPGEGVGGE